MPVPFNGRFFWGKNTEKPTAAGKVTKPIRMDVAVPWTSLCDGVADCAELFNSMQIFYRDNRKDGSKN